MGDVGNLEIAPKEIKWASEVGKQDFKITNNTKSRFAVKVKCTDNDIYSIAPVAQFVEAGKCVTIAVVRSKGQMKKDKLVICSKPVTNEDKDVTEAFKKGVPTVEIIPMAKA
ncbi:hypothetical protein Q1695_002431 [Nippostrongylus brasiliensis]|nr:hypothetical protein Q1695_002431 [Nippostrongylus brasiliensis]